VRFCGEERVPVGRGRVGCLHERTTIVVRAPRWHRNLGARVASHVTASHASRFRVGQGMRDERRA
jgi:hypothetical protein